MPPPHPTTAIGTSITTLNTPSMLVSLPLMEANITALFSTLLPTGVTIRPHLKTTKSSVLAKRLVAAGATGGCVAKLSEAETLCSLGFTDLLITSPIIGQVKISRLLPLLLAYPSPGMRIVVDCFEGAQAINSTLEAASSDLKVLTLIDINIGQNRTGVVPGAALELATAIRESLPRLEVIGIQGYEGHLQHLADREARRRECLAAMTRLVGVADTLRKEGFNIEVVTTGGTGTAEFCASVKGITEVQPGSFIFMDTDYRNALFPGIPAGEEKYKNALTITATVISKQGERMVTIDAGLKSLTTDSGLAKCTDARYVYGVMGDEHGSLSWEEGTPGLRVGERVKLIPSHIDPTVNLHGWYYAERFGRVEEVWEVDCRGMVQ